MSADVTTDVCTVCAVPGPAEPALTSALCSSWQKLYILGGEVAESAQKCTHLIASKVTRTVKFLTAISVVRHIVTPEWLEECFKCQKFVGTCWLHYLSVSC